MEAKMLEPKY